MEKEEMLKLAAEIGRGVRDSEIMKNYLKTETDYGRDAELQAAITEYSVQQKALEGANSGSFTDPAVSEAITKRMNELYGYISRSANFEAFNAARNALGNLLDEINRAMMAEVSGEGGGAEGSDAAGCTATAPTAGAAAEPRKAVRRISF